MPRPDTNRSPRVTTTIDPGGRMDTVIPREGVDIGQNPDFWGDLWRMKTRLKPRAREQAESLERPRRSDEERRAAAFPTAPPVSRGTPRQFGRRTMSPQGVWGVLVNPLDVPLELQGSVPTGFFTEGATSNYTYSPTVDPGRYGSMVGRGR